MANDPTRELQDQFLKAVRESQETVIDAIKAWIGTVQSVVPKMPPVQVPGASQLPKAEEVVASAYDFAEQLLASQRRFAEEVLKNNVPAAARRQQHAERQSHQVNNRPVKPTGTGNPKIPRAHPVRGSPCKPRSCRVSGALSRGPGPLALRKAGPIVLGSVPDVRKRHHDDICSYFHTLLGWRTSHPDLAWPALPGDRAATDRDIQPGRDGRH